MVKNDVWKKGKKMFDKERQHMYETVLKEMKDILVNVRLEYMCVREGGGIWGGG